MRNALGTLLGLSMLLAGTAIAAVSPDQAARLGKDLTAVGAERAGNKDGTIPEWLGGKLFSADQKNMTAARLESLRRSTPNYLEDTLKETAEPMLPGVTKPLFTIDKNNLAQYADKLTEGHKGLFQRYPDYKMVVYPSIRPAHFPEAIYKATFANATRAVLKGTDDLTGARTGFPFPIPKSGAEPIWNHKLKFRGSAVKRYNNQAIVKPDGSFKISKLTEDVKFKYANLTEPGADSFKLIAYYLSEVISPPRVAGQLTLVHETAGSAEGAGRIAYIFSPGLGRTNRAPDVGYDNPYIGSDGEQFNDQVDVYNGALDRYHWKLVGKKEVYIAYNAYTLNSWQKKYTDLIRPGHINQDLARYELHRVWIVEADLKPGTRHQFKKRRFYLDEDSWSIAVVDCYDNRDQLWKVQEAQLLTVPFIPTTTGIPELIYDLQSGRYFATTLVNEDPVSDFNVVYKDDYFSPSNLQRKARGK